MRFYDSLIQNIDIAIVEAIVAFCSRESRFSNEIRVCSNNLKDAWNCSGQNDIISKYIYDFENFAVTFGVIRNIRKNIDSRRELLVLIFREYLPEIENRYIPSIVDTFSEKADLLGLTHGKAVSAFSKIAFIYKPNLYFPYDKKAREVLKDYLTEIGVNINTNNYYNFSNVVDELLLDFDKRHNIKDYIARKEFIYKINADKALINQKMDIFYEACSSLNINNIEDFIYRRAIDKSLVMYGGFNRKKLTVFNEGIVK